MGKGYLIIKRVFDIAASLLALIVLFIPWIVIGAIIIIQSPGPAVFKAQRVGMNGKRFTLYKFRTMRVDSGAIHTTTLTGDPRIFPFGSFLRKSKLDETPQLINILKGEMSVIGPRPEDIANSDRLYTGKYKEILSVKPGLSSPASLYDYTHGERCFASEEEYEREFYPKKLNVELYYVEHRSAFYDLRIIWRTVVTIIQMMCGKQSFALPQEAKAVGIEG